MKRLFIEDPQVSEVFRDQRVTDACRRVMELAVMRGGGDVVPGTGGLRKIRCGVQGRGKSGGVRIIFADYPEAGRTYLLAAFGKNERANLTPAERNVLLQLKMKLDRIIHARGSSR